MPPTETNRDKGRQGVQDGRPQRRIKGETSGDKESRNTARTTHAEGRQAETGQPETRQWRLTETNQRGDQRRSAAVASHREGETSRDKVSSPETGGDKGPAQTQISGDKAPRNPAKGTHMKRDKGRQAQKPGKETSRDKVPRNGQLQRRIMKGDKRKQGTQEPGNGRAQNRIVKGDKGTTAQTKHEGRQGETNGDRELGTGNGHPQR